KNGHPIQNTPQFVSDAGKRGRGRIDCQRQSIACIQQVFADEFEITDVVPLGPRIVYENMWALPRAGSDRASHDRSNTSHRRGLYHSLGRPTTAAVDGFAVSQGGQRSSTSHGTVGTLLHTSRPGDLGWHEIQRAARNGSRTPVRKRSI